MKPVFTLACIGLIVCILAILSCQKEYSCENCREKNSSPIANAGSDQTIILPKDSAFLDGSASTDPDGTIQKWEWKKIAGPNSFQLLSATSVKTFMRNLNAGVYKIELTVTDNEGASAKDTVAITVTNTASANKPPVAKAGPDQVIVLSTNTVTLDGGASYDPDNNIVSYEWEKIEGPSCNIASANNVQTRVDNLQEGVYRFELKVTDAGGLYSMDTTQVSTSADPATVCFNDRPEIDAQLVPFGGLSNYRSDLTLATAADKIVFAGGLDQINTGFANARTIDLYQLPTKGWSLSVETPHMDAGVAISGNNIYFGGGGYYYDDYNSAIDVYDAANNIWAHLSFSEAKTLVAGAAIEGKIMFAGGFKKNSDLFPNNIENLVEIYNESLHTWSSFPLSEARGGITSVITSGKVYFAGGWNTAPSNKIDIYDNAANSWSVSTLKFLKTASNAIAYGNKIYWTELSCKVEIRNVETGESSLENLSRAGKVIGVIKDNKIVFVRPGSKYFDIYDPLISAWSVGVLPQPVPTGAGVISVNNVIYVAGGAIGKTANGNGGYDPIFTNLVWKLEF